MQNQKGFILPVVIAVIIIAILGAGGYFVYKQYSAPKLTPTACTQEAKICPDGSAVGRTGPNCEFTACPVIQNQTDQTAGWKTYKSDKWGFEIEYPSNWTMKDYEQSWGGATWYSPTVRPEEVFITIGIFPSATLSNLVNGCPTTSTTDQVIGKVKFNGLEFCKVINKGGTDSNPSKGTQVITYSIINDNSGYKITLNVIGGRQTTSYYLPESEFKYELNIIEQMISTFKFTNQNVQTGSGRVCASDSDCVSGEKCFECHGMTANPPANYTKHCHTQEEITKMQAQCATM